MNETGNKEVHKWQRCARREERGPHDVDYNQLVDLVNEQFDRMENAINELEREQAALCNHHCESEGCALPEGYTKGAARYADRFHELKRERDEAVLRLSEAEKRNAELFVAWDEKKEEAERLRGLLKEAADAIYSEYVGSSDHSPDKIYTRIEAALEGLK